ncbi:MAG: shikimate kinase [Ruminococcus sp.]|nr:shikimate kinase [Ruminococcus sp.]
MNTAPIFLCGFMGCGKSTVGKVLSKKLGTSCIDLDAYIEQTEGMIIPEIFEKKGEPYFRETETKSLGALANEGKVIATGGGALLSDKNGKLAKSAGLVVFIDTDFDTCYSRIKDDPHRPIAFNSTREELLERYEYRKPLYKANSNCIVSGSLSPVEIADEIVRIYKAR